MNMNNKAAMILVLAAGDACPGKTMEMDDACHAVTTGPVLFDICMRTLRRVSWGNSNLTSYAAGFAGAAAQACGATQDAIEDVLQRGNFTGAVRDAVVRCKGRYRTARGAIEGVRNQLFLCSYAGMEQGYMDAIAEIQACDENGPIGQTILYGMISGNRDMTMIALRLGKLLLKA
ncbi:hypothetical protein QOZ80_8AG0617020 [Eleusine coracana subsp. coracana]|nr:hypothetical protein QOZ80_8AG0617020 [Eleusine coracana subsp. coracana]